MIRRFQELVGSVIVLLFILSAPLRGSILIRRFNAIVLSVIWMLFVLTAFAYNWPSPAARPDMLAGLLIGSYLGLWPCLSMHFNVGRSQQAPRSQAVAEGGLVVLGVVGVFPVARHLLSPSAGAFCLAFFTAFVLVSLGYATVQQLRQRPAR